ncbi:MAG: OmpA family protein [Desulfomonile sp.]|jgi:outer membrane protein OmpA-like peptidoglycan-associated protein
MALAWRDWFHRGLLACLVLILAASSVAADDCKGVPNILVLFDASGFMKEKDRYQLLLKQMDFFDKAMPITADGFFNVGLRHYGLKVGMGCDNTESVLAIQPWDPQRFLNAFPRTVSYGVSSLSAGLRAAADEISGISGKSVIVLVGGGIESCKVDPIKITEQICANNPELEIHTFQIGNAQDGSFFLKSIAEKGRGTYTNADLINSPAEWHAWMRRYLVVPCGPSVSSPAMSTSQPTTYTVTFDHNSFSVRSKDPSADAANLAAFETVSINLKRNPYAQLVLHGFSDGKGKLEYNLKLSRQRAEAVAAHLARNLGIPSSRIRIVAHGMTPSTAHLPGIAPDRMGRRVDLEVLK